MQNNNPGHLRRALEQIQDSRPSIHTLNLQLVGVELHDELLDFTEDRKLIMATGAGPPPETTRQKRRPLYTDPKLSGE